MKKFSHKIIVSGIALILFGILLAVNGAAMLSYIIGGLGLLWAVLGCFTREDQEKDDKKDQESA